MAPVTEMYLTAVMILATAALTAGRTLETDYEKASLNLKPQPDSTDSFYQYFLQPRPVTIGHFAVHTLCKHHRKQFENAMIHALTTMKDSFVEVFVANLCGKKPHDLLKLWVSELFDTDGDGLIDINEKKAVTEYNYDD